MDFAPQPYPESRWPPLTGWPPQLRGKPLRSGWTYTTSWDINWGGRQRNLLSDDEWVASLFTPLTPGSDDLREQFPLSLETGCHELGAYDVRLGKPGLPGTLEIARQLGIRHPRVNGNGRSAPWVITTDLLFTLVDESGARKLLAVACKPKAELDERTKKLLAIERAYWMARGVEWLLITPGQYEEATQRIEGNLTELFRERGFKVLPNWQPPAEHREAGEVDLIAARDGHLFVLEVKSTFLRRSQRDAWLHASTTLRRAGRQLARKLDVVTRAVTQEGSLRAGLGIDPSWRLAACHAWIVDTSIERDHMHFSGFLKISVEELLIALRDDADLLTDPDGLLSGRSLDKANLDRIDGPRPSATLYPQGFNAERLVQVIEAEIVWKAIG